VSEHFLQGKQNFAGAPKLLVPFMERTLIETLLEIRNSSIDLGVE